MRNLIEVTKQFLITNRCASKEELDYVYSKVSNNINSYLSTHKYVADINEKIEELKSMPNIMEYISNLDYADRLYFYVSSILELSLFNNYVLEKNSNISQGTRNAMTLYHILSNKDCTHNCSNFYVNKSDLKNVVLSLYLNFTTNDTKSHNIEIANSMNDIVNIFNNYFENSFSPIDVYIRGRYINQNSVTDSDLTLSIRRLNNSISNASGVLDGVYLEPKDFSTTISSLHNVIGDSNITNYINTLKDNMELITLADYRVDLNINDELIASNLDNSSINALNTNGEAKDGQDIDINNLDSKNIDTIDSSLPN